MEIKLPQGKIQLDKDYNQVVLLVAGGRKPEKPWLDVLPADWLVYAADRGADYCVDAGLKIDRLYGDRDSSLPAKWEKAATSAEVKVFPVAKDATDLDLLLSSISSPSLLVATGIWGGRADHLYTNILSLLKWQEDTKGQVIMADQEEIMILLKGAAKVQFKRTISPAAVSILPFGEEPLVSITGVRWPLDSYCCGLKSPGYTVSNVMTEDLCRVICHQGNLGFYLNFNKGEFHG